MPKKTPLRPTFDVSRRQDDTPSPVSEVVETRMVNAREVPIDQVVPDPRQPRQDWAHDAGERRLGELAASIREFGVLQPLLAREDGALADGRTRYSIIAGGRRRAAAEMVGLTTLPVVVRGEESARIRMLQLVENLQRQDLSPLDEARAYQELIDMEQVSAEALGVRLHISGQHVRNRLRLLADQVFADAVERRQMSASAARKIMGLPDEEVARFKGRVVAGERLQSNDVERARARMDAAGVVNPRRKGGGRPVRAEGVSPPPVASTAPPAPAPSDSDVDTRPAQPTQATRGAGADQTMFERDADRDAEQGIHRRAIDGADVLPAIDGTAPTDESDGRDAADLDAALEPFDVTALSLLLRYGIARQWSCQELLQAIQARRSGAEDDGR